jgi:hypothetical protein
MNNLLNNKRLLWAAGGIVIVLASIAMYFIFKKDVDIAGEWDDNKAKAIALRQLEKTDWQKIDSATFATEWIQEGITHDTIGKFTMLYRNRREVTLLAFYTKPRGFQSYVDAPFLSFFEFEKKSSGWKLISSSIALLQTGSSGYPSAKISVGEIGMDIYGIFVEPFDAHQGYLTESLLIYGKINDRYCELLDLLTHEDRTATGVDDRGWTSKWKFLPKATGLYDLEVTRKGKNGPKDLTMFGKDIIKAKDVYKFDGQKYARVE